jgi:hypothetical protein
MASVVGSGGEAVRSAGEWGQGRWPSDLSGRMRLEEKEEGPTGQPLSPLPRRVQDYTEPWGQPVILRAPAVYFLSRVTGCSGPLARSSFHALRLRPPPVSTNSARVTLGRRFEGRRLGLEIAYSFAILNLARPSEIGQIRRAWVLR